MVIDSHVYTQYKFTYLIDIQHLFLFLLYSIWALATPEELEEALTSWKKKIDDGTADEVIKKINSVKRELGETTTLVAFKSFL